MNAILTLLLIIVVLLIVLLYFVLQMYLSGKSKVLKAEYDTLPEGKYKRMGGLGTLVYQESPETTEIRLVKERLKEIETGMQSLDRALADNLIDIVKLKRNHEAHEGCEKCECGKRGQTPPPIEPVKRH